MGKVTSGMAVGFSGRVGNLIFSQQQDGSTTVRKVSKKSSKPLTELQYSVRQDTTLCAAFFKPIKGFIQNGFAVEGKLLGMNQYNAAVKDFRDNALTGIYPERKIDYSKVLVTKGNMGPPKAAQVKRSEFGLIFNWDTSADEQGNHYTDQVMLMAYFPELKKAAYLTAGSQRGRGTEMLNLGTISTGNTAEIYISFIEDNRKSISNSVYLGQLNW